VTAGVPRFQELLNATKSPKIVNCKIYFNEGNSSLKELRETINHNLVALTLKDISSNIEIKMKKEKEKWYESFKILYNNNYEEHENCLSIKLNKKLLFKYRIELQDITECIESTYDDLYCVFSDQDNAQIDIFIDVSKIKFSEKQLLFITEENAEEIYIEECVQPILEKMTIFGIEGIESIYFMKDDTTDEWYVETDGSNFRKLLGHRIIDMTRLHSNNVWDIYENLGIEAAREFLVSEFESIMEGINSCHTKLLVEKMTFTGTINSISRYTLRKDESGVISKMSFEESVDIMVKAGFAGDVEKVNGISASIVCGKRGNIGSGFMDLKMDMNKLKNAKPVFREEDGRVIQEKGGNAKFKSYNNFK
jgi:DNA-directed RNA polymerase beta' subunit